MANTGADAAAARAGATGCAQTWGAAMAAKAAKPSSAPWPLRRRGARDPLTIVIAPLRSYRSG
ncbi:hypothetical protein GCM10027034_25670 [Ramlibacter solisilvae]